VTGGTFSTGFPGTAGSPIQATNAGLQDVFVAKICNDPVGTANTFAATGSLNTAHEAAAAARLADGRVLVAGGLDSSGAFTASAELYSPVGGLCTSAASLNTPRFPSARVRTDSGRVVVAGGTL